MSMNKMGLLMVFLLSMSHANAAEAQESVDQAMEAEEVAKNASLMGADTKSVELLKKALELLANQDIPEATVLRAILTTITEQPTASYLFTPAPDKSTTLILYPQLPGQNPLAYILSPDQAGALEMLLTNPSGLKKLHDQIIKSYVPPQDEIKEPEEKEKSSTKTADEQTPLDLSSPHTQPERKRTVSIPATPFQQTKPNSLIGHDEFRSAPNTTVFQQPTAPVAQPPRPNNPLIVQPAPVGGIIQPTQPRPITVAKDATPEEVAAIRRPSSSCSTLLQTRIPNLEPTRRCWENRAAPMLDHVRKTQRTSSLVKTCFEDEPEDDEPEELVIIEEKPTPAPIGQGYAGLTFFERMSIAVSSFFDGIWNTIKIFFFGTRQECS